MRGLNQMKIENLRAVLKERDRDIRCIQRILHDMYEEREELQQELDLMINPPTFEEGDQKW